MAVQEILQFFDVCFGATAGKLHIATGVGIHLSPKGKFEHDSWTETRFDYPAEAQQAARELVKSAAAGADTYICPYLTWGDKRGKGTAVARTVLHCDVDTRVDIEKVHALGGCAIASGSEGHAHVYIQLAEPVPFNQHTALERALTAFLSGDPAKISDNDVLRPPGTFNQKPTVSGGEPVLVSWLVKPAARVHPKTIAAMLSVGLPEASETPVATIAAPEMVNLALYPHVIKALTLNSKDRSDDTMRIVGACYDAGLVLGQARWVVATRIDLAQRLKERHDDDVLTCWVKAETERRLKTQMNFWGTAPSANGHHPKPVEYDDGAHLLDMIHNFLRRFINYPNDYTHVAHTLWIAHSWFMDLWESTPRIAFLSPEPASGKSRALEVTEALVPRPVHSVNVTPAYLFRKVADPEGRPTILYDEIDTVFGPKAKENEEIRGLLNSGHRKGAMAGRCVVKGKRIETEEIPSYCAVALAGLHTLPDTILTRSVVVHMRRRAIGETIEPWRMSINGLEAIPLKAALAEWSVAGTGLNVASADGNVAGRPLLPEGIEDRDADVWEALVGVADMAGGHWPSKSREAAVASVAAFRDEEVSLGVQLLWDIHRLFTAKAQGSSPANVAAVSSDLVSNLKGIEEAPWANYGKDRKGLDTMRLAKLLRNYGIKSRNTRINAAVFKAYHGWQFEDAWVRYGTGPSGPLSAEKPATPTTGATFFLDSPIWR